MGVKAELSGFLNHFPAVDGPDERKALLTFTGPKELGIYLDWQGANVVFTERLLEELSRRGKGALLGFMVGLANTLQVANSVDLQQQVVALRAQVDALDEAAFRAEFPVPLPAVPAERPSADPAMLAAAVVNEVLVPYYKLGEDQLRQKAGGRAAALAERMAEKVEPALASDLGASAVFDIFKQNPEAGQVGMLKVLKAQLAGDPALAGELADLFTSAAAEPEGGGLQALVEVSLDIGVVGGDVVGAVVGADVLKGIGAKIDVDMDIETVEAGGTVVGAVLGGSGPISIGGEHHHGNIVDTGGGAYIGGDVQSGGDFVGRDKVVQGDDVGGDKITVGDISGSAGIAIGSGAQATGTLGVSGEELAQLFGSIYQEIKARPQDPDVDKDELVSAVKIIEKEAGKGEEANAKKVERWLKFLADMAPDILKVTAAALANPAAGVATAIGLIAKKAQEEA